MFELKRKKNEAIKSLNNAWLTKSSVCVIDLCGMTSINLSSELEIGTRNKAVGKSRRLGQRKTIYHA